MKLTLRPWAQAALDVLFPPRCAACDALGLEPFCAACEEIVEDAPPLELSQLDAVWARYRYGGPVARAVRRLKYDGVVELARPLGVELARTLPGQPPSLVVPIPLDATKLRQRGFNQARELARALPGRVEPLALRRRPAGGSQVGRSARERGVNLRGAFTADEARVAGRGILLVDDVVTTGATARAAAASLRAAGARTVRLVALAATVRGHRA